MLPRPQDYRILTYWKPRQDDNLIGHELISRSSVRSQHLLEHCTHKIIIVRFQILFHPFAVDEVNGLSVQSICVFFGYI